MVEKWLNVLQNWKNNDQNGHGTWIGKQGDSYKG